MTTNTYSPAAGPFAAQVELGAVTGPILVATDGSEPAEAALTAASVIARATGATVEIATVIEPANPPLMAPELAQAMIEVQEAEEQRRDERIKRQLHTHLGPTGVRIHVAHGRPSTVIPQIAKGRQAAMIVTAFGQHSIMFRILGTETPLRIARTADTPVLCVPPGFARMPRVVVVAVDFGVECARAAAVARPLLSQATHVYLVHVKPKERLDMPADVLAEWEHAYEAELTDAFARASETLALSPEVGVTTAVLRGTPARELLDFAASTHADLLVAGHGHRGRLERLLGGSVASQLFRGAHCALLLAPDVVPDAHLPYGAAGGMTETLHDRARWLTELLRFTERNAGRIARVEIDDPRLGAQVVAHRFPFRSVDFDWRDDAVEVMLGGTDERSHATHVVRAPASISIQRTPDGRDAVLRVEKEEGQLLLYLDED
ncbi:MAG TPA: universal stress protein [Gemmatimonadaceae bacterium]|nr:universal stress protein [Gemmatimonadaceae bacterium]